MSADLDAWGLGLDRLSYLLVATSAELVGTSAELVGTSAELVGTSAELVDASAELVGTSAELNAMSFPRGCFRFFDIGWTWRQYLISADRRGPKMVLPQRI